jgi:hypothetical protein
VRSFRLDRVAHAVVQEGRFSVPGGFDPAAQAVEAVSGASGWFRRQDSQLWRLL